MTPWHHLTASFIAGIATAHALAWLALGVIK
jgi:hypothetical protein